MSSSLSPLPKKYRGQSPASEAPAHMAGGMGARASHMPPTHAAVKAQPIARASQIPNASRNLCGLAKGPRTALRYANLGRSICRSWLSIGAKMLPPKIENKGA